MCNTYMYVSSVIRLSPKEDEEMKSDTDVGYRTSIHTFNIYRRHLHISILTTCTELTVLPVSICPALYTSPSSRFISGKTHQFQSGC